MKLSVHYSLASIVLVFFYTGLYIEFLLFFGTIVFHELGHVVACLLFKQKVNRLNITAVGGILDVEIRRITFLKELLIYASGIIFNLFLIMIARFINNEYYQKLLYDYNMLIILFNILPIFPLDGFRIFDLILSLFKDAFREFKIIVVISWLSLIGLFVFSFANKSIAFIVIAIFLLYQNIILITLKSSFVLKKIVRQYQV